MADQIFLTELIFSQNKFFKTYHIYLLLHHQKENIETYNFNMIIKNSETKILPFLCKQKFRQNLPLKMNISSIQNTVKSLTYKFKQLSQANNFRNSLSNVHIATYHQNHREIVTQSKKKDICQNTNINITRNICAKHRVKN